MNVIQALRQELPLLTRIIQLMRRLLQTSSGPYLDYAAVQAVVNRIGEQISVTTTDFNVITGPYHALSVEVAPLTGLGLQEIWAAFLSRSRESQNKDVRDLEELCENLSSSSEAYGTFIFTYLRFCFLTIKQNFVILLLT